MKKNRRIPARQMTRGAITEKQWDKLLSFIERNDFTVQDFLACVCANLLRYTSTNYITRLSVGGTQFDITIQKKGIA